MFESVKSPVGFISLATNSLGKTDSLFILLADLDVFQHPHTRRGDGEAIYSKTCVGIPFWKITFLSLNINLAVSLCKLAWPTQNI